MNIPNLVDKYMRSLTSLLGCAMALSLVACGGGSSNSDKPLTSTPTSSLASSSINSSLARSSANSSTAATCPNGKQIVGYYLSKESRVQDIQFNYLTHVNYSFVLPNHDGSLQLLPADAMQELNELVSLAKGSGTKVSIAIGGWNDGDDSAFRALSADATRRARFVSEVIAFVENHNLDGVDIDWEYPRNTAEANNFTDLVQELRAALDKTSGKKYLTAAVIAQNNVVGQHIQTVAFNSLDFLNIMAYDGPGPNHAPMSYATDALNYWSSRGAPREKLIIGVPFYARPSWTPYNVYVGQRVNNACVDNVDNNFYNGIPTIRLKAALANTRACGVMIWELSQDTHNETSLLKAIWEVVREQPVSYSCN